MERDPRELEPDSDESYSNTPEEDARMQIVWAKYREDQRKKKAAEVLETAADLPESCLAFRVRRASRLASRFLELEFIERMVKVDGWQIRTTQIAVLAGIRNSARRSIAALAMDLGMHRSTLSRSLKRLTRRGFVVMEKGGDRRSRYPKLTTAGESAASLPRQKQKDGESLVVHAAGVTRHKERELFSEIRGLRELMPKCDGLAIGISSLLDIRACIPLRRAWR